jgi:hypothetical protein
MALAAAASHAVDICAEGDNKKRTKRLYPLTTDGYKEMMYRFI